jgi:hypothetical protein
LSLVEEFRSFTVKINGPGPLLGERLRAGASAQNGRQKAGEKKHKEENKIYSF